MHKNHADMPDMSKQHYRGLLLMVLFSFIAMYILMYAMVNTLDNVYNNFNQFYMAGLMAAPMAVIELAVMRMMYQNKQLNWLIIIVSLLATAGFFLFIRQQAAISDKQFLRSMIPHHSGAILMCDRASLQDAEIQALCDSIIQSQQEEIDQMEAILQRLEE